MKKLSILMLIVLCVSSAALALDDKGNPNDPRVNERANACYEDGSLAGRCRTQWDWDAGWYLIRFQFGLISRANFPAEYVSVLPPVEIVTNPGGSPLPPPGPSYAPAGCYFFTNTSLYGLWNGNPTQLGVNFYNDAGCTSFNFGQGGLFASEPSLSSAENVCTTNGYVLPVYEVVPASATGAWSIYRCTTPPPP